MTVHIVAKIRAVDAAAADAIQKHLSTIRDHTNANESGSHMYVPTRDTKDPLSFVIIEEYDDQAAVGAHIGGEAFKAMMADAETLFVGGAKGLEVGMYTKF